MNRQEIEMSVLLPSVTDATDRCDERLTNLLVSRVGIDAAHVTQATGDDPQNICIHYDSDVVSTGEVRELAKRTGAQLDQRYGHWIGKSDAMHARRASAIETRLSGIDGVNLQRIVLPSDGGIGRRQSLCFSDRHAQRGAQRRCPSCTRRHPRQRCWTTGKPRKS